MTLEKDIKMKEYQKFVLSKLSADILIPNKFQERISNLQKDNTENITAVMVGAIGTASEAGELLDIIKKIIFQGKNFDDNIKTKIKYEMGDVIFYITTLCIALNINLNEIINMNKDKLDKRYPKGFSVSRSENKKN